MTKWEKNVDGILERIFLQGWPTKLITSTADNRVMILLQSPCNVSKTIIYPGKLTLLSIFTSCIFIQLYSQLKQMFPVTQGRNIEVILLISSLTSHIQLVTKLSIHPSKYPSIITHLSGPSHHLPWYKPHHFWPKLL